ncbi:MAG: GAF domain-containing SpoIIE family protein phosphatase [Pseudomonadota bacterium]
MSAPVIAELPPGSTLEQQLALLADLSRDFASSLDIEDALQLAIQRFMDRLHADAASIFLLGDRADELVCHQCAGPVNITGLTVSVNEGIVGRTVRTGDCQIVRDVREDPNFSMSVDQGTGFVTRSILCVPLNVGDRTIGAIELMNKRTGDGLFNERDRHLVTALAASAALAINNARMAGQLVEKKRLEKELELAAEIQNNLLPSPEVAGCPITGINVPAWTVSGDFFDYFVLPDGRVYFNVADVSGKGMNAALLMAKTSSLLRCLAKTTCDAGELLARVNRELCETASHGMFVTIISGFYDPASDSVTLSNAGHPPALMFEDGGGLRQIEAGAPPLGITAEVSFSTERFTLGGRELYLFTDGLSESPDANGKPLDIVGVADVIRAHAELPVNERLNAIVDSVVRNASQQHDDVTMVVVGAI